MIDIDFENKTYTCPYCGEKQRFEFIDFKVTKVVLKINRECNRLFSEDYDMENLEDLCSIHGIICLNNICKKPSVIARTFEGKQVDILPNNYQKSFPDYIPISIIRDFQEGVSIIETSPRASAILFRKCLEGMIEDCFGVSEKNLHDSIEKLFADNKTSADQNEVLNSIRKIGNFCAHPQLNDNALFDFSPDEVSKVKEAIEYLFDEWYIEPNKKKKVLDSLNQMANKK